MDTNVPERFETLVRRSGWTDLLGPLYLRRDESGLTIGVRLDARHANVRGTAHGGLLATIADISMGYATALSRDPPIDLRTASLTLDFIGAAKPESWLEGRTRVLKVGKTMAFASGEIWADGVLVARASAVFAVASERG